jgi:hypothetical protein
MEELKMNEHDKGIAKGMEYCIAELEETENRSEALIEPVKPGGSERDERRTLQQCAMTAGIGMAKLRLEGMLDLFLRSHGEPGLEEEPELH